MKLSWITALSLSTFAAGHYTRTHVMQDHLMDYTHTCDQGYLYCGKELINEGWNPVTLEHWAQYSGVTGGNLDNYLFRCEAARYPIFDHYCKYGCVSGGSEYNSACLLELRSSFPRGCGKVGDVIIKAET